MPSRHATRGEERSFIIYSGRARSANIFGVPEISPTNFKRGLRDPERGEGGGGEGRGEIFGLIIDEQTRYRLFVRIREWRAA